MNRFTCNGLYDKHNLSRLCRVQLAGWAPPANDCMFQRDVFVIKCLQTTSYIEQNQLLAERFHFRERHIPTCKATLCHQIYTHPRVAAVFHSWRRSCGVTFATFPTLLDTFKSYLLESIKIWTLLCFNRCWNKATKGVLELLTLICSLVFSCRETNQTTTKQL